MALAESEWSDRITLAESDYDSYWMTLAESEWSGRITLAESEWAGRIPLVESDYDSCWITLAESEWPNPMPWLLQSETSYTIGISWSLVRQIPRHMPRRRQSRLDHAWG